MLKRHSKSNKVLYNGWVTFYKYFITEYIRLNYVKRLHIMLFDKKITTRLGNGLGVYNVFNRLDKTPLSNWN